MPVPRGASASARCGTAMPGYEENPMTGAAVCPWCGDDPLYRAYHDEEWGVPCRDEDALFEFLILEGMQAGLAWITILRKRQAFRAAFDGFDAERVARYTDDDRARLLADPGIVRNRLKVRSAVGNARAYLEVLETEGSFSDYIWSFVGGETKINAWKSMKEVPALTPESDAMSKALKKRGFKFVGSTICYAFMQAAGLVNDHVTDCFRYRPLGGG